MSVIERPSVIANTAGSQLITGWREYRLDVKCRLVIPREWLARLGLPFVLVPSYDGRLHATSVRCGMSDTFPRLPHYAERAAERYGYIPSPQLIRWYVDAIEGNGQAPAEIGAALVDGSDPEREIWDVLVCDCPQRVVFCPRTRSIITFLPPAPKPPHRRKRELYSFGRHTSRRRRPRVEESEELA